MLMQKDCVTHLALEALCLIKVCGNSLIIWGEIGLTKKDLTMKLLISLFSNHKVDVLRIKQTKPACIKYYPLVECCV